jgi:hypothetical protein
MEKAKDWATSGGPKMAKNHIFQKRPFFVQDHFGVTLRSFCGHFGVVWGAEGHFGVIWGQIGVLMNHFGVILGPFWDHFGSLYKKKDPKTTQNDPYQNNKKTARKWQPNPNKFPRGPDISLVTERESP